MLPSMKTCGTVHMRAYQVVVCSKGCCMPLWFSVMWSYHLHLNVISCGCVEIRELNGVAVIVTSVIALTPVEHHEPLARACVPAQRAGRTIASPAPRETTTATDRFRQVKPAVRQVNVQPSLLQSGLTCYTLRGSVGSDFNSLLTPIWLKYQLHDNTLKSNLG